MAFATLLLVAPLALAGCAGVGGQGNGEGGSDASGAGSNGQAVTIADGWAKSADADGMTGVFGTLENSTADDLTIDRVESDAAGIVELHEVTDAGIMQEIAGDVVISANGSYTLAPGEDHIMLMELTRDLLAGDEVTFTVFFTDGGSVEMTVAVKDYSGANEDYGGDSHDGH